MKWYGVFPALVICLYGCRDTSPTSVDSTMTSVEMSASSVFVNRGNGQPSATAPCNFGPYLTLDVTNIRTPFISLLFTPLDNLPLINSEHILITALAQDKQYGAVYNNDGTELIEAGGPPLLLEPVQATIILKGSPVDSVKAVDIFGLPTDKEIEHANNTFAIDGRYATCYYEVKR